MGIFNFEPFEGFHAGDGENGDAFRARAKSAKRWTRRTVVTLIAVVIAVAALYGLYSFYMEYWQIEEIGQNFTRVFWTNLFAKGATACLGFLAIFLLFLVNLLLMKRFAVDRYCRVRFLNRKWPYVVASLVLALFLSGVIQEDLYQKLLLAMNGQTFGAVDPLFTQDVGYYVFLRPFLTSVTSGLKGIVMTQILLISVVYLSLFLLDGQKNLKQMFQTNRKPLIHVVANILLYFLLMALTYKFVREDILFSAFGKDGDIAGAGYVNATVWLAYYRAIPFALLAVIALVTVFLYRNRILPAILSIAVIPAAFLLTSVAAGLVQTLSVSPNERNMERPYIEHNIEATRAAYQLDQVTETDFDIADDLSAQTVQENLDTLQNIRITDFGATLTAYNQLQYLRRYYTFHDSDIVPYEIDGKTYALSIAAREMNQANIEESAQSYANKMFRYTHGFGAVVSPINRVTAEGQPQFLVKDIPPVSTDGMAEIKQPRIYYGELTNESVVVNPNRKELDYSEGTSDIENSYDGQGGIRLGFLKRALFAVHEGDYRLFFSGNIDADSRILLNRNIMQRVTRIAPFFRYDDDPYLVIDDNGDLEWVIDGYTSTDQYPYAQRHDGLNYIRNSVKVIVNAYDGTVRFYITDPDDPIARAYDKMYPGLFTDGPIPAEIASHITMPQYLFRTQSEMYQRYHVANAEKFYDKDDVWRMATEKYVDNEVPVEPYFNVLRPDGATADELVLTMPFVLGDKYNMVGMLMARTTPEHYGELTLYRFPKSRTVYGPMQIENKIDNDPEISREMTLWGQGGSTVIRGNMLVVPVEQSLLYVEPIYITSQNNASLPELKRIVVGYRDSIAMETTLEGALAKVFAASGTDLSGLSDDASPTEPNASAAPTLTDAGLSGSMRQQLVDAYGRFKSASAGGDWAAMGQSLAELDALMQQLQSAETTTP